MEVRAFAEQLLFSNRLEDKLFVPDRFTDDAPGAPITIPDFPGRPDALDFRKQASRAKVPFPGVHELDDDRQRGYVLHFFANHELLALEAMAMMLLAFPDAPKPFRMSFVETILEEQAHMTLYTERMAAAGVTLGEIPVNDYFWRALKDVDSLVEFLAGISLTFEQANLDFALFYRDAFKTIGDADTADVMATIYRDEVGHVKNGLDWFRRWKDPALSDFDAYTQALRTPLSPSRARGPVFTYAGRRAAGLDDDFIDHVRLDRTSKGRPPRIYYFNPACEAEQVYGAGHTPPAGVREMQRDLGGIMAWLGAVDDVVLVDRVPSDDFRRLQIERGLPSPAYRPTPSRSAAAAPQLIPFQHIGRLYPWGWSPRSEQVFASLRDRSGQTPEALPLASQRALGSKAMAVMCLRELIADGLPDWCRSDDLCGHVATTMDEVEAAVASARQGAPRPAADAGADVVHDRVVIKAGLGASGQNAIRVDGAPTADQQRWIARNLRDQDALVVEPWLDRVVDLSAVFHVQQGSATKVHMTRFLTDRRGQYLGSVLGKVAAGVAPEVLRFLYDNGKQPRRVRQAVDQWAAHVAERYAEAGYDGPIGIDMLVHRDEAGYRVKPIVEINPRWTMGHVAAAITRRVHGAHTGVMLLLRAQDVEREGRSLSDFARAVEARYPYTQVDGQIVSGSFFATEVLDDTRYAAWCHVGRRWDDVAAEVSAVAPWIVL